MRILRPAPAGRAIKHGAAVSVLPGQRAAPTRGPRGSSTSLASQSQRLEVELGNGVADVQAAVAAAAEAEAPPAAFMFDCLGLAQAMVDFSATVDDDLLARLGMEKGSRRLIGIEERADILSLLEGREYAVSAGGSLSNTLVALARLGEASARLDGGPRLRVGMAGLLGADPLGEFYASQLRQAGVEVCSPATPGANTGTVVVLTSPDAQRTMLSYLGSPAEVSVDAALEAAIARSRLLVVEGYLWELPHAARTISRAIAAAQRHGCVVAMTAGDAGVVERHHAEMWAAIGQGIDLLFTNAGEAAALLRHEPGAAQGAAAAQAAPHRATGEQLALQLGPHCGVVVVTDGDRGSHVTALGQLHCVPPCWLEDAPVDTCGAGDAYAAGLLYGYLRHMDLVSMGRTAARVASAVISRHGATLTPDAAAALVQATPAGKGAARAKGGSSATQRPGSAATLAPTTPRLG